MIFMHYLTSCVQFRESPSSISARLSTTGMKVKNTTPFRYNKLMIRA